MVAKSIRVRLAAALVVIAGLTLALLVSPAEADVQKLEPVGSEPRSSEVEVDVTGRTVIDDPDELAQYAEALGVEEIEKITVSRSGGGTDITTRDDNSTFAAYYLANVSAPREFCALPAIRTSYYTYPGGTMTVTDSISNTYSADVGVDAQVVSAGVGFSVTGTSSISDAQDVIVDQGTTKRVQAYAMGSITDYEVWNDPWWRGPYQVGSGSATRYTGVCFVQTVV